MGDGDIVIANDASTLPASLIGVHLPTGAPVELRLAGRETLLPEGVRRFMAIVFGAGDFRTPTERRPPPPVLQPGDTLQLGPLSAEVVRMLGHPRLIEVHFRDSVAEIWEGVARHGRPIQYAYLPEPLAIWDTWTRIAGQPVAFEPPSAGFILDWSAIRSLRLRGARFATLTHAAGISSTGDAELDRSLPFDEPYYIPPSTAALIDASGRRDRVIAIGTTVVRSLEHAARPDGTVQPGYGIATERIGPHTRLRMWMPSCPECTSEEPATMSCSAPFRTMKRSAGSTLKQKPEATGVMNLATRCSSPERGSRSMGSRRGRPRLCRPEHFKS